MPQKQSEAIILRTYPLRESDLLVTLFTRTEGKVKGVAKAAKRSKKRFGGALEPLTYVRVYFEDRERQELARIDSCDVLLSPLAAEVSYPRAVALGHVAEVLDELLPDREANDTMFRLARSVLANLQGPAVWMPLTYFDLWTVRLVGFLPELTECIVCGSALNGSRAYYHALLDGLMSLTISAWPPRSFHRNRALSRARCSAARSSTSLSRPGRNLGPPTCAATWCRSWSVISKRSW